MRGLKLVISRHFYTQFGSHLLQMRGLKLILFEYRAAGKVSHLLQMRGLKPMYRDTRQYGLGRIFYRCVD